jgi:general L-amino acid transport system substrate-binding protein
MRCALATAALLLVAAAVPARAGQVLDLVRQERVLRCGAEPRPGVAAVTDDGGISGLAVDLCRAAAIAVLGPEGRIAFRLYDAARDFDFVRDGTDELAFLSGAAIAAEGLAPLTVPGPAVFIEQVALLVPQASAAHRPEDLAGGTICLMIGSAA